MERVHESLYKEDSDIAMEYQKRITELKALLWSDSQKYNDASLCPDKLHEASIHLVFAQGAQREDGFPQPVKFIDLLNSIAFFYHVNDGMCGTITASTDCDGSKMWWTTPEYEPEGFGDPEKTHPPIIPSSLKLSAGDALKRAKLLAPAVKKGSDIKFNGRGGLWFNHIGLDILPWINGKDEPVYIFLGINGHDDILIYTSAMDGRAVTTKGGAPESKK